MIFCDNESFAHSSGIGRADAWIIEYQMSCNSNEKKLWVYVFGHMNMVM